jgi:nucleoside-diphosphate-sugar epimerase
MPADPDAGLPLLLAGFGYVARRLAARHPEHRLRLAHARRALPDPASGITPLAWDLDADAAPATLDARGAVVLYTIAPGGQGEHDLRIGRWLGALKGTPKRIVYVSTTGVWGDRAGATVTEQTPPAPRQPRSKRRLDAENQLTAWCAVHGVELAILRTPAIYGPARLPLARLKRGEPVLAAHQSPPGYRIHVDDLVDALERLLWTDIPPGVWTIRDDSELSISEYLALVARLAGLPPPAEIGADEAAARLPEGMRGYLGESRRLDDRVSRRAIGHRLRYPQPADGIRASLDAMGLPTAQG